MEQFLLKPAKGQNRKHRSVLYNNNKNKDAKK
jgi:hypothetical protein